MNNDDIGALFGLILIIIWILALIVLILSIFPTPESPKFSVIDTYKECSVVKFIPPEDAKSHYFLDCSSK